MNDNNKLSASLLAEFTGTERWYRHPLMRNILYTDGARYLAEHGGAYWLLDEIATTQLDRKVRSHEFQAWKLTVNADNSAQLVCEDGNYNVVYSKKIEFTDFPLSSIELWFENNTIYLPSER